MKTKHTKRKWVYQLNPDNNCSYIIHNNQKDICTDVSDYGNPHNTEEAEANAKLVAASPELLKALSDSLDVLFNIETQIQNEQPITPKIIGDISNTIQLGYDIIRKATE